MCVGRGTLPQIVRRNRDKPRKIRTVDARRRCQKNANEELWHICGLTLKGENRDTRTSTCPSATQRTFNAYQSTTALMHTERKCYVTAVVLRSTIKQKLSCLAHKFHTGWPGIEPGPPQPQNIELATSKTRRYYFMVVNISIFRIQVRRVSVPKQVRFVPRKLFFYKLEIKANLKCKIRPRTCHGDPDGVEVQLYSFLNLVTGWKWMVDATPRPLFTI